MAKRGKKISSLATALAMMTSLCSTSIMTVGAVESDVSVTASTLPEDTYKLDLIGEADITTMKLDLCAGNVEQVEWVTGEGYLTPTSYSIDAPEGVHLSVDENGVVHVESDCFIDPDAVSDHISATLTASAVGADGICYSDSTMIAMYPICYGVELVNPHTVCGAEYFTPGDAITLTWNTNPGYLTPTEFVVDSFDTDAPFTLEGNVLTIEDSWKWLNESATISIGANAMEGLYSNYGNCVVQASGPFGHVWELSVPDDAEFTVGSTFRLAYEIETDTPDAFIARFESADESVATVDAQGNVTIQGEGTTTVYIKILPEEAYAYPGSETTMAGVTFSAGENGGLVTSPESDTTSTTTTIYTTTTTTTYDPLETDPTATTTSVSTTPDSFGTGPMESSTTYTVTTTTNGTDHCTEPYFDLDEQYDCFMAGDAFQLTWYGDVDPTHFTSDNPHVVIDETGYVMIDSSWLNESMNSTIPVTITASAYVEEYDHTIEDSIIIDVFVLAMTTMTSQTTETTTIMTETTPVSSLPTTGFSGGYDMLVTAAASLTLLGFASMLTGRQKKDNNDDKE